MTTPHTPNSHPTTIAFTKGHGTQNDFIILPDPEAQLSLTPQLIATLCDRQRGIGADGILRVATTGVLRRAGLLANSPTSMEAISDDDWFMDYYNADGSVAEMCGNGTRVFAHYVRSRGLVPTDQFTIGTRAGAKPVTVHSFDDDNAVVSVAMGPATSLGESTCSMGGRMYAGMGVDMGNPHLACVVPGLTAEALAELTLERPEFDTEFFPEGVNVEVLTELTHSPEGYRTHMRVYERGVGETRSCGTGTVAAARAALAYAGFVNGAVMVKIPGGQVEVTIDGDTSTLRGPSALVATGELHPAALS